MDARPLVVLDVEPVLLRDALARVIGSEGVEVMTLDDRMRRGGVRADLAIVQDGDYPHARAVITVDPAAADVTVTADGRARTVAVGDIRGILSLVDDILARARITAAD